MSVLENKSVDIRCNDCGDKSIYLLVNQTNVLRYCGPCLEHRRKTLEKLAKNVGEEITWQEYTLIHSYLTGPDKHKIAIVRPED